MQIVDAQIHTWGQGLPSNASHIQVTHFTPAEAIARMDEGGVAAAVIHPPGWDPNSTAMAFQAVEDYPGRFAIMGAVPLDKPESRARIADWRKQPGMLGLRYGFLHDPAKQRLADGEYEWLFVEAEKAGVPIATLATDSLAVLGKIAERHRGLKLTIDHLGGRGGLTTTQTSRSRPPAGPAIRPRPTPIRSCPTTCTGSSTRSAPIGCSGAPTSPRCRARGGNA
jgi:predicted TIM-barrel fold metal-dependent hydrolase